MYCEKVDKAEKLARITMSVKELITAPNERIAKAPQAAQALSTKLLMSTCVAAAPLPTAPDGPLRLLQEPLEERQEFLTSSPPSPRPARLVQQELLPLHSLAQS